MKNPYLRNTGISLLEVLLSLTIIASITTMAVRYFTVSTLEMRVSHAILQLKQLTDASYEWLQLQKQNNFSSTPSGTSISMEALLKNQLTQATIDTINPWGGNITVEPGDDTSYVKITLENIPQKACLNINQQLKSINHSASNTCTDKKNNTFSAEF